MHHAIKLFLLKIEKKLHYYLERKKKITKLVENRQK